MEMIRDGSAIEINGIGRNSAGDCKADFALMVNNRLDFKADRRSQPAVMRTGCTLNEIFVLHSAL